MFPVVNLLDYVVTEVVLFSIYILLLKHDISQSSVATHLRCGRIFSDDTIANFPLILTVKHIIKSVNIG